MKCDNCKTESTWLEMVGSDFICAKCIQKNKTLGFVFRTKAGVFRQIIRKLKPANYLDYMKITREQIDGAINLSEHGIKLKTTNVVDL